MCPPRGEPTRGLAPSVGARAGIASATSNTRPLRHTKLCLNRSLRSDVSGELLCYQGSSPYLAAKRSFASSKHNIWRASPGRPSDYSSRPDEPLKWFLLNLSHLWHIFGILLGCLGKAGGGMTCARTSVS